MTGKKKRTIILAIAAVLLALAVWTVWGNTALELNTYTVGSKELPDAFDGYRIAHVSDLHNAEMGDGNEKLLAVLREADPDIIAITGDLIDSRNTNIEVALAFAEKAMKIAPCYYVTGNHEARVSECAELKAGLEAAGVVVLENERGEIELSGETITILGVDDPSFNTDYLFGDSASVVSNTLAEISTEDDGFAVLLSHRPELFDTYVACGVDLALSGHAHGGQFRLPFVGGLVAPNQGLFPKYDSGLYTEGMDALEQCYAWDEEQFKAFLIDCPATEEQQSVLDVLRTEFRLVPLEDAFAYVKKLQAEFDLSQIPYTEEYYDPDMNAAAPVRAEEWIVTYDGGFWRNEGNAGIEIPIQKSFCWGEEKWYIPAVYICDKGLVIDYCKQADPVQVKAFIDKWDLLNEGNNHYTKEQQEQIEREHPLHTSFKGRVTLNGYKLQSDHSCGLPWIPESCLADGLRRETEAIQIMEHYGLDVSLAWYMQRSSYRWGEVNGLDIQSLTVRMERQRENIAGQHFQTPTVGESISLTHPMTGKIYTLTVHEVEQQELPERAFHDPNMEYPSHYLAMSYSLEPDISGRGFMIQDCTEGDRPRQKKRDPDEFAPVAFCNAAVIGVIGGADGPTSVIMGQSAPKLHAACSSLRFEPIVDDVEWRVVFSEKLMDDVDVDLI